MRTRTGPSFLQLRSRAAKATPLLAWRRPVGLKGREEMAFRRWYDRCFVPGMTHVDSKMSPQPLTPEAALQVYEVAREQFGLGALPELTIEESGSDWILAWQGRRERRPAMSAERWELWLRKQFGPRELLETLEG